jgi:pro-apoptotic serine protease NMA111
MKQGVTSRVANGIGILVSADPIPLVVVSRTLVPSSICDIWITVGNHTLPGRVVYLGIVAVVTLSGTRLQGTNILPICTTDFKVGERLDLFAIDKTLQLVQLQTEIREIAPTTCGPFFPPRWRLKNVESLCVLGVSSDDGFLLDPEDKSVVALWMSIEGIKVGLHYDRYVRPIIEALQNAREIENRCCGWSFGWMALSDAVQLGLSDQRASQIAALVRAIRSVPRPILITGKLRPDALDNLRIGDIILEVNGRPVVRMADIHILSQFGSAQILVLRNRQELNVNINTQHLPSEILSRIISWAGVLLHETHDSVLEQITPEFEEIAKREGIDNISRSVYISSAFPGSPASLSLSSGNWILEVDGHKVMTMDDMVHVISTLQTDREYMRVKMIGPNGVMNVRSVKPEPKFWPAWFLEWKDNEWVRTELE